MTMHTSLYLYIQASNGAICKSSCASLGKVFISYVVGHMVKDSTLFSIATGSQALTRMTR